MINFEILEGDWPDIDQEFHKFSGEKVKKRGGGGQAMITYKYCCQKGS